MPDILRRLDAVPVAAWTLGLVVAAVLLLPLRGAVPSLVMALVVAVGAGALADQRWGPVLPPAARPMAALLAAMLALQVAGLLARGPTAEDASALGSALCLAMLLPVAAAAARRDPGALESLLVATFAAGALAGLLSVAMHVANALASDAVYAELVLRRLTPFGRARHAILGAGGLAAAGLAGLALLRHRPERRGLLALGLVPIAAALLMTQSRGPLLALALALVGLVLVDRLRAGRAPAVLLWAGLCFAVPVGLVLLEPWIVAAFCRAGDLGLCRPSMRQEIWEAILPLVAERPLFGWGPSYRLGSDTVGHAHNGLIGTAFLFGLPVAILLVAAVGHALVRAAGLPRGPLRDFALAGLYFAAGFVGADLPNPFAFLNTHVLFLWLPLAIAVAASATPGLAGSLSPAASPPRARPPAPR